MSDFQFTPFAFKTSSDDSDDNNDKYAAKSNKKMMKQPPPAPLGRSFLVEKPDLVDRKSCSTRLEAFSMPLEGHHHSKTGLVHCRVFIEGRDQRLPKLLQPQQQQQRIHFCTQDKDNKDDLSLHLIAVKENRHGHFYRIYNASSESHEKPWEHLADLERREFHNDSIAFTLTTADGTLDACVFFNKPSMIKFALEGAPRQLELGVFTPEGRKLDKAQACQVIKDCCKYSESKAQSSAYKIVGDSRFLTVYQSVAPYRKPGFKKYGLNLHGRGQCSSTKNCQMISEVGKRTIQMAKSERGVYHVDFTSPLNAVQAFGFALAQLDL